MNKSSVIRLTPWSLEDWSYLHLYYNSAGSETSLCTNGHLPKAHDK